MKRAKIARQTVGQHWHDAVGEIGGIAPRPGLAVERRPGAHIMRDIGDGDPDDVAAPVLWIIVRFCENGIVVIAGIRRVDGDEGQVRQVFAPLEPRRRHTVGFGNGVIREIVAKPVLVDRDQRDGPGLRRVAQPGDDAGARQAEAVLRPRLFGFDQFAVLRTMRGAGGHAPLAADTFVDGQDAPPFGRLPKDAQDLAGVRADAADKPAFVGVCLAPNGLEAREDAIPLPQRRVSGSEHQQHGRLRALALPFKRAGIKIAVLGRLRHLQDRNGGKLVGIAVGLAPFFQMPVFFQPAEQPLEVDPVRALDPEGLRNISLGRQRRVFRNPVEDVLFGGKARHASGGSTATCRGHVTS